MSVNNNLSHAYPKFYQIGSNLRVPAQKLLIPSPRPPPDTHAQKNLDVIKLIPIKIVFSASLLPESSARDTLYRLSFLKKNLSS